MTQNLLRPETQALYYSKEFNHVLADHLKKITGEQILDVGCNTANLGKWLSDRGNSVIGIDIDQTVVEEAKRKISDAWLMNLDRDPPPITHRFDLIIFADILEHLKDPLTTLHRFIPLLTNQGKIIISVPNIANFSMRWRLLLGKFDYTETGILDQSHLRFFTLKSLRNLLQNAGLQIEMFDVTTNLFFPFSLSLLQPTAKWLTRRLPGFLAHQFIVIAKPQ